MFNTNIIKFDIIYKELFQIHELFHRHILFIDEPQTDFLPDVTQS